jgi:hypothetical protein
MYKGAPNFVYAVFSANQILEALPPEQRGALTPGHFKQCGAAPPQLEADVGSMAFFVCDVSGGTVCGGAVTGIGCRKHCLMRHWLLQHNHQHVNLEI